MGCRKGITRATQIFEVLNIVLYRSSVIFYGALFYIVLNLFSGLLL